MGQYCKNCPGQIFQILLNITLYYMDEKNICDTGHEMKLAKMK